MKVRDVLEDIRKGLELGVITEDSEFTYTGSAHSRVPIECLYIVESEGELCASPFDEEDTISIMGLCGVAKNSEIV